MTDDSAVVTSTTNIFPLYLNKAKHPCDTPNFFQCWFTPNSYQCQFIQRNHPKVFDEMSKLISPPRKLIILLQNNKAYPISITQNCANISLDFTLIEQHETYCANISLDFTLIKEHETFNSIDIHTSINDSLLFLFFLINGITFAYFYSVLDYSSFNNFSLTRLFSFHLSLSHDYLLFGPLLFLL